MFVPQGYQTFERFSYSILPPPKDRAFGGRVGRRFGEFGTPLPKLEGSGGSRTFHFQLAT